MKWRARRAEKLRSRNSERKRKKSLTILKASIFNKLNAEIQPVATLLSEIQSDH